MTWMDQMLIRYEREIAVIASFLLLVFNLAGLYFIKDLMSYDEIIGYLPDGGIKSSDLRYFTYVMLIIALLNVLYVFAVLCAWFSRKTKRNDKKSSTSNGI